MNRKENTSRTQDVSEENKGGGTGSSLERASQPPAMGQKKIRAARPGREPGHVRKGLGGGGDVAYSVPFASLNNDHVFLL